MKFIYTKHAEDKLKEKEAKKFGITKTKLQGIVRKPKIIQDLPFVKRAIGDLDSLHELCVIYRFESNAITIITFFPAKEGRYDKEKN